MAVPTRFATVNGRPARQAQMLSDFINSYFPTTRARAGLADRRSYLAALPDVDLARTPILNMAIQTLCFAHIGAKTGDSRLIKESQDSYGNVLSSLIQATTRPNVNNSCFEPKAVITSIMLLCLYDDAVPIPHQGKNGWATHYWGIQQLLQAYGPSILNMDEPFDRLIFWNLRMPCWFLGVARRKAIAMGQSGFLDLSDYSSHSRGPLTDFYRIAMQIPAVLERTDQQINSSASSDGLRMLCGEIITLREQMNDWFATRICISADKRLETPELFTTADTDAFDIANQAHCFMSTSTTFEEFFRFRAPGYLVKNHTYLKICLLVLDCTLLRLLHFTPLTESVIRPMSVTEIENDAFAEAADLCRSLHHYSCFEGLAYADWTDFITEIAQNFFEEFGAAKELGWCQAVRVATKLRRDHIKRTVQPKTLCRMGDAGPGFAAATRYRTRHLFATS